MATYYGRQYKLLEIKHLFKEIFLEIKILLKSKKISKPKTETPIYIAMIDGESFHGGMCDRFKGIITLYAYCKYKNIPFRIRYTYPFRLEDYLSPATYDWTLKEKEYTDNPLFSKVLYMRGEHLARRLLMLKSKRQIHFYTNRDCLSHINKVFEKNYDTKNWGELFRELFKPAPILEKRLKSIKKDIGSEYYAAVFRFQNLLGDFKEYHYQSLDNNSKAEELINRCIEAIMDLKKRHNKKLLVTSDSITFLNRVARIEGVHIIPGSLIHMDGQKDNIPENSFEIYMKSFLDFYMLCDAKKIYRIGTSFMYPSEFPIYAAKVNDIPFESIVI